MSSNKRQKLVFLLLFFAIALSGCSMEEIDPLLNQWSLEEEAVRAKLESITLQEIEEKMQEQIASQGDETDYEQPEHDTYAYNSLTPAEKLWYEEINRLLKYRRNGSVQLSDEGIIAGLTEEAVEKVYQCVLIDHPEYFYVEGYEYAVYSMGDKLLGIEINATYTMEEQECREYKAQIDEAVAEILKQAPKNGSDYEKIKFVYEYIIYHTRYDKNAEQNQNIYSVFAGNASVCQGYAKATQYLLNCLGVECTLVFGKVGDGEAHSWNMVKADEEYYYLDTTWGDASYTQNGENEETNVVPEIKYDYLCVTTNQLSQTHNITHDIALPECVATANNYYIREGCYFQGYDEEQIRRELEENLYANQEMVAMKCATRQLYEEMREELIAKQRIFEFVDESYTGIAYIEEEEQLTLTFWVTK